MTELKLKVQSAGSKVGRQSTSTKPEGAEY